MTSGFLIKLQKHTKNLANGFMDMTKEERHKHLGKVGELLVTNLLQYSLSYLRLLLR